MGGKRIPGRRLKKHEKDGFFNDLPTIDHSFLVSRSTSKHLIQRFDARKSWNQRQYLKQRLE